MASPLLVIGCSEQLPNELRAYHLIGTSTDGVVLLSRHGITYSATESEVTAYPKVLERMLGLVLANMPSSLQAHARRTLTSRWNRNWGVEAEDLGSANDNGTVAVADREQSSVRG